MHRAVALSGSLALAALLTLSRTAHADDGLGFERCNRNPSKADTAAARQHYEQGKALYDRGDSKAIELFRAAYMADCTKHELLVLLSFAYANDAQHPNALAADELYLQKRGASLEPEDRSAVEQRIANLRHKVEEQKQAQAAQAKQQQAEAEARSRRTPEASEAKREPRPLPIGPIVLMGVGGAAVIGGAVLLPVGLTSIPEGCGGGSLFSKGVCDGPGASQDDATSAGRAQGMQRLGVGLLAGGALMAGGGFVWWWLSKDSAAEKKTSSAVQLTPVLSPQAVGLHGAF